MTRVTELSVRNFKAVDEAEVHPGGVNLIVGRNNVGKTSLLEALHLALDPSSISRFDGNQDKVVREGAEEAVIDIGVSRAGRTENQSVTVERQESKDVYHMLRADVENRIRQIVSEMEVKPDDIISELYKKSNKFLNKSLEVNEPKRRTSTLLLGEEVRYVSDDYWEAVNKISLNFVQRVRQDAPTPLSIFGQIRKKGGIRSEKKMAETNVRFITEPKITEGTPAPNTDGNAIRRSRIEDFLIDNDIVDGLVDFSFGRLVFEDGDEREEVPYDFMGSGFKTLVGILWELYDQDADTEVMLIEEPAVHMHPGYVNEFTQQLLQVARQEDVQLFLTTHREDLIESFFAPPTEREHGDFLREEFRVIQMTDLLAKELDYEQAEAELEELNTDLRGI